MEAKPKSIKVEVDERVPNVLIKQEVEWHANQEVESVVEPLSVIKTEADPYHTDAAAEAHTLQEFTTVPQTDEHIKTELMLEEEFIGPLNESEVTYKYDVLPLADDQQISAGISHKKSESGQLSSGSDSAEGFRKERMAHPERQWKCEFCPLSFKTKPVFTNHLKTHDENRKREIACDSCDRTFYTLFSLWGHKKVHATGRYQCKDCGTRFKKKGHLTDHIRSQHLEATFECEFCARSFSTAGILKTHLSTHSKDRKREFACNSCDRTFYSASNLRNHKKTHSQDSYHCKVCGKRFPRVESLKVHMLRREHFDETQEFTPQPSNDAAAPMKPELMSDEEFIAEGNDGDAVFQAEGSQQPPRGGKTNGSVTCEVCNNSYPAELIQTHMRMMHSNRTYQCQVCAHVCSLKTDLERHLRRHDNKDERTRPYACEQCGRKFLSNDSLKRHTATQHKKNRKPEFNCELCEKKYYTKHGLKEHMLTHTGVTVSCEVCGAHFARVQSLRSHMIQKHTEKTQPYIPEPPTSEDVSIQTKEELISEEEFLDEEKR